MSESFTLNTGPRGLDLAVQSWGSPGERPLVVILHGYLDQSAAWDTVARALAPRFIVAPDHRGHGLSEHVGRGGFYHFWDYVADVDALIDHVGGTVDLVGHSMGGTMAALVSACVPDKVRRLVLVEGLGPPDGAPHALAQARTALKHRRHPPTHRPSPDLDMAITRMRRGNPDIPEDLAPALAERVTRPDPDGDGLTWTWDPLHRARSPVAFDAGRFLTFLRAIEAPTLMVEGARSPYRQIPGLDARRASVQDARTLVFDDCGHNPHHTHAAELAACIRDHFDART